VGEKNQMEGGTRSRGCPKKKPHSVIEKNGAGSINKEYHNLIAAGQRDACPGTGGGSMRTGRIAELEGH